MSGLALSPAAAGLLRAMIGRSGLSREQVLLTSIRSRQWHSLTFSGERHEMGFRIIAPNAGAVASRMTYRLEDAEFSIPGLIVADIEQVEGPNQERDGSVTLGIAALTIEAA